MAESLNRLRKYWFKVRTSNRVVLAATLLAGVTRAQEQLQSKNPRPIQPLLDDVGARNGPMERVLVRDGSEVTIIPVETIDYIEAVDDHVRVVAGGKKHMKRGTLSSLEKQLPKSGFIRAHRSFILNIDRLSKIELYAKDSRVAILLLPTYTSPSDPDGVDGWSRGTSLPPNNSFKLPPNRVWANQ